LALDNQPNEVYAFITSPGQSIYVPPYWLQMSVNLDKSKSTFQYFSVYEHVDLPDKYPDFENPNDKLFNRMADREYRSMFQDVLFHHCAVVFDDCLSSLFLDQNSAKPTRKFQTQHEAVVMSDEIKMILDNDELVTKKVWDLMPLLADKFPLLFIDNEQDTVMYR
jgi:hypothetical protein